MTKRSLHNLLYSYVNGVLVVCLVVLVVTVLIAPMSKLFVAIAIALGVILSLVSMEELTGGRGLSWLALPIILIGDFSALCNLVRRYHEKSELGSNAPVCLCCVVY